MPKNDSTNVVDLSTFALKGHLTSTDTPVYEFVSDNAEKQGMTVNALGQFTHPQGKGHLFLSELLLLNSLREKTQRFGKEIIEAAIDIYIHTEKEQAEENMREALAVSRATKSYSEHMKKLEAMMAMAMPDDSSVSAKLAAAVMAKTVWQAKRKLHNMRVTRHLMLVFVGEQDGGKTWFAEKFTSPVREMRIDQLSFTQLLDERNIKIFGGVIGLMDEMAKAGKADIEELKSIITTEYLTRRPMRSNNYVEIPQRLTFVGTSNKGVDEIIMDETGNRRFFQVNLIGPKHPRILAFRAAQDAFDWLDFWRSVDQDGADPCEDMSNEIRATQEERHTPSSVEFWLEQDEEDIRRRCVECADGIVEAKELFNAFDTWCHANNNYKMSLQTFQKVLRRVIEEGRCEYLVYTRKNNKRIYQII